MQYTWGGRVWAVGGTLALFALAVADAAPAPLESRLGPFDLPPAPVAHLLVDFADRAEVNLVADGPNRWSLNTPRPFSFPGGTRRAALDALCAACGYEWTAVGPLAVLRSKRLVEDSKAEVAPAVLDYFLDRDTLDAGDVITLRRANLNKGQELTLLLWCPRLRPMLRAAFEGADATDLWCGLSQEEQQNALSRDGLRLAVTDGRLRSSLTARVPRLETHVVVHATTADAAGGEARRTHLLLSGENGPVAEMTGYLPEGNAGPQNRSNVLWPLPGLTAEVGAPGASDRIVALRAEGRETAEVLEATFLCVPAEVVNMRDRAAAPLLRYVAEDLASWPITVRAANVSSREFAAAVAALLNARWLSYETAHMELLVPDADSPPRLHTDPPAPAAADWAQAKDALCRSLLANLDLVWTSSMPEPEDHSTRVAPWDVLPAPVRRRLEEYAAVQASPKGKNLPLDLVRPYAWQLRFRLSGPLLSVRGVAPSRDDPKTRVEF